MGRVRRAKQRTMERQKFTESPGQHPVARISHFSASQCPLRGGSKWRVLPVFMRVSAVATTCGIGSNPAAYRGCLKIGPAPNGESMTYVAFSGKWSHGAAVSSSSLEAVEMRARPA